MKLIVGLGNPGREYDRTRHNAGFMVVERLVSRHAAGQPVKSRFHAGVVEAALPGAGKAALIRPTTYMNLSGRSVVEALNFYKLSIETDLLVITDDLALPTGSIRLRPSGGAGGHNGLKDIGRMLATEAYPRLRVGVGPKPPMIDQAAFVLGRFNEDEHEALEQSIERAADAAEAFCADGLDAAMNRFNTAGAGAGGGWGARPEQDTPAAGPNAEPDRR